MTTQAGVAPAINFILILQTQRGIFDGIDAEQMVQVQRRLGHQMFDAGAIVLAQGDLPRWLYIIESGSAELLATDESGMQKRAWQVGPGEIFGEGFLLTGRPAATTVRAVTDLHVAVIEHAALRELAETFPVIYRNLSAILAARIGSASFSVAGGGRRVAVVLDQGAPPLISYALASSLAWHTRRSTLLVVAAETMAPELEGFSQQLESCLADAGRDDPRARVAGLHPADALLVDVTSGRSSRLTDRFGQVVILTRDGLPVSAESIRVLAAARTEPPPRKPPAPAASYTVTGWGGVPARIGPDPEGSVEIPPLQPADEEQLRRGLLDTASPAGKALGWVARDLAGLKVGIAVGGGAARGFALVGVLDALRRAGVTADCVAGTSIGAAIGAAYTLGYTAEEMTAVLQRLGGTVGRRLAFPAAVLSSAKLRAGVRTELGERLIEELPIPFVATATDLVGGEQVKFVEGSL